MARLVGPPIAKDKSRTCDVNHLAELSRQGRLMASVGALDELGDHLPVAVSNR
jgi:hypothetical protein